MKTNQPFEENPKPLTIGGIKRTENMKWPAELAKFGLEGFKAYDGERYTGMTDDGRTLEFTDEDITTIHASPENFCNEHVVKYPHDAGGI